MVIKVSWSAGRLLRARVQMVIKQSNLQMYQHRLQQYYMYLVMVELRYPCLGGMTLLNSNQQLVQHLR